MPIHMNIKALPITLPVTVAGSNCVLIARPIKAQRDTAINPFILIILVYPQGIKWANKDLKLFGSVFFLQ